MRRVILVVAVFASLVQAPAVRADAPWAPQVFVSLTPCVLFDTRNATAGILGAGLTRAFNIVGSTADFTSQGGTGGGCGVPAFDSGLTDLPQARSVLINIVAADATGGGNLKAWSSDLAEPVGGVVNYQLLNPPMNNSNAVPVQVRQDTQGNDITLKANGAAVHVRGVVLGYYSPIGLGNTIGSIHETVAGGVSNTAGGTWSTVGGGIFNLAGASAATVGGGHTNTASGSEATVGGGDFNTAGGRESTVGGGAGNAANGDWSTVSGGTGADASHYAQLAYASGDFANGGDAQTSTYVSRAVTGDTAVHPLFLDGTSQRLTVPPNTAWTFEAHVTGIDNSTSHRVGGYILRGAVANKNGTIVFVGTPTTTVLGEDDTAWNAAAGTGANASLQINVQGNGQTIRWVATITTTEVTF